MNFIITNLSALRALRRDTKGQDLLEYALLVALIAVVCVGAIEMASGQVSAVFERITQELNLAG